MRLTYTDLLNQHLRNINQVGSIDTNILADFAYNLGQRYQLALARLANYRTTTEYAFSTGMNVTLLSSGVSQTISSITSSSTTATVTTSSAHGYSSSNVVEISGVSQSGYNGTYTITVTSTTAFTYTLSATQTVTTATCSQYIPLPMGEVTIEGMYITVGSVNYPLQIINNRFEWEKLNAIQIQASAVPQFYFPRRDDFGIWPIPQTTYTGNISYHYRDRNLSVADYTTGTVSLSKYGTKLTGFGTTFTSAMVGRWFCVTDTTIAGQGYWIRIAGYTSATVLTLSQPWTQATTSGATYRIGESPELPEEGHGILAWGTASDFYAGMRKDAENGALYDNLFFTGNPTNTQRKEGDSTIAGGLIGLVNRYGDRDNTRIVTRRPKLNPLNSKVFATRLS